MTKNNYNNDISNQLNVEYVVLQTTNMNLSNKSNAGKLDKLAMLLEESESVSHFRRYLDSINSGHFLDFWFACQGFKNFDKSDPHKLNQLMKVIYKAYIRSESPFAVPLKSNTKKSIVDKLSDRKIFDPSIFDTAQLEIREILAEEFLNKFYKSEFYTESNIFDRGSVNSIHNNLQLNEMSTSSGSSTGYIGRRVIGSKNLVLSKSSGAVVDGCIYRNQMDNSSAHPITSQSTGTVTGGIINNCLGANGGSISSKERSNLSETDPPAFAKILSKKLEEVFVEQSNFDKILRLVKSVPIESDTDDSHSSALGYLMNCQWYNSQSGHCCSVDGDVTSDSVALLSGLSGKMKTGGNSMDIRDDYAQGILENHCSRIGLLDQNDGRQKLGRDNSETRNKWKKETGSITSYDSGVATSLEQYSRLGLSPHLLDTFLQRHRRDKDSEVDDDDSHYHHHHHHHHNHRSHGGYPPVNKELLTVNNVSDVSSNIDSGISSTYEHLGRRFQPTNDKVSSWMSKNPKVTSKACYNSHKCDESSFPSNITSGMPPNTPLISSRGLPPGPRTDPYSSYQSNLLPRFSVHNQMFSPPSDSARLLPCNQNIESWLDQQDTNHPLSRICESRSSNYCSSTVGVAGSELLLSPDNKCHRDPKINQALNPAALPKDQQHLQSTPKPPKPPGPLVVGYYIGNDPVPYRTQIPDAQHITLGQFKSLIAKKGPFRYFFKRYCDEFECGVVHEEITKDDAILPLWEGKVVAKIEKSD